MPVFPDTDPLPADTPRVGACSPWASIANVCEPCSSSGPTPTSEQYQMASDVLYELSGRRFPGLCDDTVRPCGRRGGNDGPMTYTDVGPTSGWGTIGPDDACGCSSGRTCGCVHPSEITLGAWPVVRITEVLVDGALLDPSAYRIDDRRYLVRLPDADGSNPGFPCCQDVTLPSTEADTFEVSFTYGVPPPPVGVLAASVLACELAMACANADGCRLPRRVTSITRQGISMTVLDPFDFLDQGRTGIYEVDLFLATYGPARKQRLSTQIVNPDIHRAVRRAGT